MRRYDRREFLTRAGTALGAVGGTWLLTRCGGGAAVGMSRAEIEAKKATYDPSLTCTDTTGLWPAEIETRTQNHYTDHSPHEDKFCFDCANFRPPEQAGACGACDTVKGPINPLGYCNAWSVRKA